MTYEELVAQASDEQVYVLVAAVRQLHKAGRLRAALTDSQWKSAQALTDAVEREARERRARNGQPCVVCRSRVHTTCVDCGIASGGRVKVYVCAAPSCRDAHEKVARCSP